MPLNKAKYHRANRAQQSQPRATLIRGVNTLIGDVIVV